MSLTLKKKQAEPSAGGPINQSASAVQNASSSLGLYASKGETIEAALETKIRHYETMAAKCLKKGTKDYNETLAKEYFKNVVLLRKKIDAIRVTQAQSDLLVETVKADSYLADTASFMTAVSRAQSATVKTVDPEKVNRTATRIASNRSKLDESEKLVNNAMASVTTNMLRTKLDADDEADIDAQLNRDDPQMGGFDADFLLFAQNASAVAENNNNNNAVPTFDPAAAKPPDEPEYLIMLRQMQEEQKRELQRRTDPASQANS
jgi:hypothetical protein